jgi:lysophospholipase L1-like esterase
MKPSRVLLFIAACLCLLAMLCVVLPHRVQVGSRTLRWPTLGEVFEPSAVRNQPSEVSIQIDTIAEVDTLPQPTEQIVIPKVAVDSVTDSRVFLSAFYASLAEASTRAIRVVHYGDSQIEEDRITTEIRKHLQARYGGAGVGMMPLAQTIPNRSVKQQLFMSGRRVAALQGPRRYMVYALRQDQRQDGLYGPMGQVCWMADSLVRGSEEITTVCTPTDGAPYTRWRVLADTSVHYTHHGDTMHLQGRGAVYGLSQESNTGVIVDNIPMRGCLGLVFTKIDAGQLSRFYSEANVRLIIMQFGGNAIPFNEHPGTIQGIVKGLRDQVRYIKACAPEASILFVGPSDMLTQIDGEWQTYPMVPYMDRLLRKMALEEEIAYFSLYRWMGGSGSMLRWQEVGLATSDGVHFLRSGARKAGNAIAEWILEGNPN